MDKHFYNEASAKKLGWEPSWFGEKYFDDKYFMIYIDETGINKDIFKRKGWKKKN